MGYKEHCEPMLRQLPLMLLRRGMDGKTIWCSQKLKVTIELQDGALLETLFGDEDRNKLSASDKKILSGEILEHKIEMTLFKDGKKRLELLIIQAPSTNEEGVVDGIFSQFIDITNYKVEQGMLRVFSEELERLTELEVINRINAQKKYQMLFDSLSDAVFVYEADCEKEKILNLVEVNESALRLLSISKSKIKEVSPSDFLELESGFERFEKELFEITKKGETLFYETVIKRDDKEMPVELNARLKTIGEKDFFLISIRDESYKKMLENKQKAQEEMIIQQAKMASIGELMAMMAHQWKQPLNVLSVYSMELKDRYDYNELDKDGVYKLVDGIKMQVGFMSHTIDDFRNFFRPGKRPVQFKVYDAIKSVLHLFEHSFETYGIKIEVKGDFDVYVMGFQNEFQQVILNLFNNAKDVFYEKKIGRGVIKCEISHDKKDGVAKVIVSDNGGGIPKSLLPNKIFEKLFTTKGDEGTGLGLYMSKMIIEGNLGGKIYAKNSSEGAELHIELPLQKNV